MEEPEVLQLVQRAKVDQDAYARLFERYLPLVYKTIRRYHLRDYAQDDWLQEARVALLNAIERFDSSAGSRFGSYYAMVLQSHLNSLLRQNFALKRTAYTRAIVMPDPVDRRKELLVGRQTEDAQLMLVDLHRLLQELTAIELAVLIAEVSGTMPAQPPRVRHARERTKRKLEHYINDFHR